MVVSAVFKGKILKTFARAVVKYTRKNISKRHGDATLQNKFLMFITFFMAHRKMPSCEERKLILT